MSEGTIVQFKFNDDAADLVSVFFIEMIVNKNENNEEMRQHKRGQQRRRRS